MPAEQAFAPSVLSGQAPSGQAPADLALADQELAAMRQVAVPEVWAPDGAAPAGTRQVTSPEVWAPERATAAGIRQAPRTGDRDAVRTGPQEHGQPSPRQFALLIVETLSGIRPVSQLAPLLSKRGSIHLQRLLPLFSGGLAPRVLRVLTSSPARDAVEMTLIVSVGPRTRALAVRLERAETARTAWRDEPAMRWLCTDIEAA
jgi:hypothetical protein